MPQPAQTAPQPAVAQRHYLDYLLQAVRAELQRNRTLEQAVDEVPLPAGADWSEGWMGIIAWIVLGLIAGAIGKFLMPGRDPGGIIVTILIGIVGAVIGGFIGTSLGMGDVTGVNVWSIVLSVVGAIVLLIIYRMVTGRRAAV